MTQPDDKLGVLMEIALDLTASLTAHDRYNRLLNAVTRVIPCDAACLLRLDGEDLIPVAGRGLAQEAMVQRFSRREHPRLDRHPRLAAIRSLYRRRRARAPGRALGP